MSNISRLKAIVSRLESQAPPKVQSSATYAETRELWSDDPEQMTDNYLLDARERIPELVAVGREAEARGAYQVACYFFRNYDPFPEEAIEDFDSEVREGIRNRSRTTHIF